MKRYLIYVGGLVAATAATIAGHGVAFGEHVGPALKEAPQTLFGRPDDSEEGPP